MIDLVTNLKSSGWSSLIEILTDLVVKDAATLANNTQYYMKLRDDEPADSKKTENMYKKLVHEQERFQALSEILYRLDYQDIKSLVTGIEEAFKLQQAITPILADDYVIYFRKHEGICKVYYMPL